MRYDSRFLQKRPIIHYGTARANALFLELICFKIIAERFALLKFIDQNAKTVLILNTVRFALLTFNYGTVRAKPVNFRRKKRYASRTVKTVRYLDLNPFFGF
jgi:hypothetical protein